MIWTLLALHAATVALVASAGARGLGRWLGAVVALPLLAATAWGASRLGGEPVTAEIVWVEDLGLRLAFVVDEFSALTGLIVSGIGVAVVVYAVGYFSAGVPARLGATLLAFGGSMLGLVWADSVWTLFLFWEATSITSFLLVGHQHRSAEARIAARRALLITVGGGLAMLAGFVVLADLTGTDRLSEMAPVDNGVRASLAAVLVLLGAATKSAQVPFHVWLPGAMAAPTPVSAYLHSATMVKAGVVLLALTTPVLSGAAVWRPLGLTLGLASVVWGALLALRHSDAKLILAYGTVSQLGLMFLLLSLGTAKATFAAISIVVAHAIFKAALFMVVGEVDVRAGTRDVRELSGLGRSMPVAATVVVVSAASMAGAGPLLGFPAKEAAVEAALGLSGGEAWVGAVGIIGGSVLTVAYTTRFLVALLGPGSERAPTKVTPARAPMTVASVALGIASVVGFVALGSVSDAAVAASERIDPGAAAYSLYRWPGFTDAFYVSLAIVGIGVLLGFGATRLTGSIPRNRGADLADATITGTLSAARRITGRVQHGSLPIYVATMAATAALATAPFLIGISDGAWEEGAFRAWDEPLQAVTVGLVLVAATGSAVVGSRLGAALGLGAVGLGVSALFLLQGAPDLALTQLLVETVVVVGFVLGLGRLRRRFPPVGALWRGVRIAVATAIGCAVGIALAASAARPAGAPNVEDLAEAAVDDGGGNNTVNVILTDLRALDTLGEVLVLAVVAVGVLALAQTSRTSEEVVA